MGLGQGFTELVSMGLIDEFYSLWGSCLPSEGIYPLLADVLQSYGQISTAGGHFMFLEAQGSLLVSGISEVLCFPGIWLFSGFGLPLGDAVML